MKARGNTAVYLQSSGWILHVDVRARIYCCLRDRRALTAKEVMYQVDFIADHGGSREAGQLLPGQALRLTQQFLRAGSMHAPTIFCFLLVG